MFGGCLGLFGGGCGVVLWGYLVVGGGGWGVDMGVLVWVGGGGVGGYGGIWVYVVVQGGCVWVCIVVWGGAWWRVDGECCFTWRVEVKLPGGGRCGVVGVIGVVRGMVSV